jgi:two-component system sensor histidine kinase AtoS
MLAGVAHDLRNPMTALSGYAQILANEEEEAERTFFSQKITRNIKEMTAMLNDVLAFSRGDVTLKPSLVELKQFADSLRDSLLPLCEPRGIELSIEADRSVGAFDLAKVTRILLNLGRNAADALSRGGMLFVEIRERKGDLFMQVKDNGPGLPEAVQENLFKPVVERSQGGGTGLGLSIVKRFVDDHDGTIQVESSSETGTTFTIELPRLEPDD